MMPLTWKQSWKVSPKIRASWQQEEFRNEVPNLDLFSVERPHRIDGFLGRLGPKNDAFDLEKILESHPEIRGSRCFFLFSL